MAADNRFPQNFFRLLLFLPLLFFPFSAQALDLYFYDNNIDVTGGINYVIKDQTPADKLYTGTLICQLDSGESLPKTTVLTTTLRRSTVSVRSDTHIYSTTDWSYNSTLNLHFIMLKNGVPPKDSDYRFEMPATGPETNQLRTGTYYFSLNVNGGVTETNSKNNTATSETFDYTVYSGRLFYNNTLHNISSLTRSSSAMCSADTYLSSLSGDWEATWWADNFAKTSVCANSSPNLDGFSRDLKVVRDVSLATAPILEGSPWSIKGQSPAPLALNNMRIECNGSPPSRITLDTSLQQGEDNHEIAHESELLTAISWLEDTTSHVYY